MEGQAAIEGELFRITGVRLIHCGSAVWGTGVDTWKSIFDVLGGNGFSEKFDGLSRVEGWLEWHLMPL